MLQVTDVSVRYGARTVADHVSFAVEAGQWVMLLGPNGAGKSTIINAISQGIPYTGSITFGSHDTAHMKAAQRAACIGVLAQTRHVAYSFTVGEIVRLGRYSYSSGPFGGGSESDEYHIQTALEMTGMAPFVNQSALTLSGGELQRAFLAQVFAQDPKLLILDEPASHLDPAYQKQIFDLAGKWLRQPGRAVLSVVHDLSLARAYGTHAILLNGGHILSAGRLDDVLAPALLQEAYGMDIHAWMRDMLSQWEK